MTTASMPTGAQEQTRTRPAHRRRRTRLVLTTSLLALTALVTTIDQPTGAAAAPTRTRSAAWQSIATQRAQLDKLAQEVVKAGAPGVIVRVDDGTGRPVEIAEQAAWSRSDHLLGAGDEFRMASNTKTMMATLVLQLVAEGKLALTDPVDKWLPGQVPNGKAITLRMLLNHTSGLFDYAEDSRLVPAILGKDRHRWTPAELLAVGVGHDPLFAPGTQFSYSNTNYVAIGAVLEKATRSSLSELVQDRIARPLNLKHTYYAADSSWRGAHAHGYEPDAAHMSSDVPAEFRDFAGPHRHGHVDVSGNDPSWGASAGAVVSTAPDWSRFYNALMSGKLLPAAQLAELRTTVPQDPEQPDGPGYGLGIQTGDTPCGTIWGHDGGMPGYLTANVTNSTGNRTATLLISTESWSEFGSEPKIAAAAQSLQTAVICSMFGKPVPG
ncbi:serine hydrolase domain-containing protein [Kribbella sp. NPDC051952]|uniref:serine hydrolase domain-containing protein n=1 Tax=Kribbella sp. NPDC051952 TaxID=3154851 RepID=UPI00343F18EE